jgi:lysozyme
MARNNHSLFPTLFLAGFAGLIYWLWTQSNASTDVGYADMSGSMFDPLSLTPSQAGKDNIQRWEGFSRSAYQDIGDNWTIGIGHLIVAGDGLSSQSVLTDGQVYNLFAIDLENAERAIKNLVRVPISQGMFDALTDFVFEFGQPKFANSTLLRLLNNGDYAGAAAELPKWVHSGGKVVSQLVDRRDVAQQIFNA